MFSDILSQIAIPQNLAFWGSWASIVALLGVLYNTWRISKIPRFIEDEREKIEDIVQPFDLYYEIREAIQTLQQHGSYSLISEDQKGRILEGLTASKSCLDLYFHVIHGLKGQRDNVYLAAGHRYWDRKRPEKALEHFEKAQRMASDEKELAECLYGLRACYAWKKNHHACAIIDQRLSELQEGAEQIPPFAYVKSGITMVFIHLRALIRHQGPSVLPLTWPARFGNLRDLPRKDSVHSHESPGPMTRRAVGADGKDESC